MQIFKTMQDMVIWETIGLWHYPIPGLFLLAQFVLGGLLALVNLVNNSVFLYLSDEDGRLFNNDKRVEGEYIYNICIYILFYNIYHVLKLM